MRPGSQAASGSPPRAWGGLAVAGVTVPGRRLTPTCVGRTSTATLGAFMRPAHPHVRGEDGCAGGCGGGGSAHPHVRGEDPGNTTAYATPYGSPPRAWGGQTPRSPSSEWRRLTPTCVGRTGAPGPLAGAPTAHPHVRGEDNDPKSWPQAPSGSPPRAWGGPVRDVQTWLNKRLTPMCVGRTSGSSSPRLWPPAHPHVRGEDFRAPPLGARPVGSPPRAWGGHRPRRVEPVAVRLTPTCVGRTARRRLPG